LHFDVPWNSLERNTKMSWFYYNEKGEKIGPFDVSQMKDLAKRGIVTRETMIENANGRSAKAGTMKGFEFPSEPEPVYSVGSVNYDWYYYDEASKKIGPFSVAEIKELVNRGIVVRDTLIENANGQSTKAGTIKGLEFPPQTASIGVPVPPPLPDSEVESPSEKFTVIQKASSIIFRIQSGVSGVFSRKATKPKSSQAVDAAKPKTTVKDSEEVEPSKIIPDVVSSVPVPRPKQSQTAFCRHCGSEISRDSSFCSSCGQRTSNNTAPSQPPFYQPSPPQQAVQVIVHNSSSSSAKSTSCGEGCGKGCLGLILLFFVMMLIGKCSMISEKNDNSPSALCQLKIGI